MKGIGAHVSTSGGVEKSPANVHEIGAQAFALFPKNQKQCKKRVWIKVDRQESLVKGEMASKPSNGS